MFAFYGCDFNGRFKVASCALYISAYGFPRISPYQRTEISQADIRLQSQSARGERTSQFVDVLTGASLEIKELILPDKYL